MSVRAHSTCQYCGTSGEGKHHVLLCVVHVVGPSSLEYSRLRHCEQQFWSDPPADELLLRRRIRAPDANASDSQASMSGSLTASSQQTGPGASSSSSSSALSCSYFASAARHQRIFVRSLSHAAGDPSASSTVVRLQRNRPSLEVETSVDLTCFCAPQPYEFQSAAETGAVGLHCSARRKELGAYRLIIQAPNRD